MKVVIKEREGFIERKQPFFIIINQKDAVKLGCGTKRTIIFYKSTKIKVKHLFLESEEIVVTSDSFLEIALNKYIIGFYISIIILSAHIFLKVESQNLKLIFLSSILISACQMKRKWYKLIVIPPLLADSKKEPFSSRE